MAQCLRSGGDAEALTESLARLVECLGVASFEAEYIRGQAQRLARPPAVDSSVEARTRDCQEEHARRLAAIRSMRMLESELREQLLEAEEERFRAEMMALLGGEGGNSSAA
jgi:hypothetical protein